MPKQMTIVVAGGAGGIGTAICRQLMRDGHTPVCLDLEPPKLEHIAYHRVNLTNETDVNTTFDRLTREYNVLDGVVNTAGHYCSSSLQEFSWEQMRLSFEVNVEAPLRTSIAWLHRRESGQRGVIVNIGSAAARFPSLDLSYATTKAAIEGLTRSLAKSLAKENVSVFCVAPGVVDTRMSQAMPEGRRDSHIDKTWLKRACTAEEVADVVCYLLNGMTHYMTGAVIPINGGLIYS